MDLDGKAIELIQTSAKAEHVEKEIGGLIFSTKKMDPVYFDPRPDALQVHSLTALVDYLKAENLDHLVPSDIMLHVESPTSVALVGNECGPSRKRTIWMRASAQENPFKFGTKYDAETFNIVLQSLFVDTGDRAKVLQLAGTIKSEAVQTDSDDGITQTVEARKNIAFAQNAKIPNPVSLVPWRTFREVGQPGSIFVFRAHEGPTLSLWEADGAAWKLEAMLAVKAWLAEQLPDIAIIA